LKKVNILIVGKFDFNLKENFIESVFEAQNIEEAKEFLKTYNIDIIIYQYDESLKEPLKELLNFIKKIDKKIYVLVLSYKYEKNLFFKYEIDYLLLEPVDKDRLVNKLKKVLFIKSNNRYRQVSLFSGVFEPFFIRIFLFNETALVNLSLFLTTLEVSPISILKIINRIKEKLDVKEDIKIEITIEKSIDYVHLTTNISLFENDYYTDWMLQSHNIYTYKLPLKDLLLNKLSVNKKALKKSYDNEFLDFDEDDNNFIHHRKKISAMEYLESHHFSKDDLDDLEELMYELDLILYAKDSELNNELVEDLIKIFFKYRAFFVNFLEINDALYSLIEVLENLNLDKFSQREKKFIFKFIKNLHEDLKEWFENIFVKKSATDIHYLDASLLSSIMQFQQLLNKVKE